MGTSNKTIKTVPLISINYSLTTIFILGMTWWFRMNTEQQNNTFLTQKLIYMGKKILKIKCLKKQTRLQRHLWTIRLKTLLQLTKEQKKAFYSSCDEKSTCISAAVGSIWSLTAGYTEQRSHSMFNYTAKLYSTTHIDLSCLLKHISLLTSSSHQNKLWDVI